MSDLKPLYESFGLVKQTDGTVKHPAAVALGSIKTAKKAAAARVNGAKGGRPRSRRYCPMCELWLPSRERECKRCGMTTDKWV